VVCAEQTDIPAWLALAAEVEPLFGPMVEEPGFMRALRRNIARGTALCVRTAHGPPGGGAAGTRLLGGLLYSPKPPVYTIGWLAVTSSHRRQGIGRALIERVFRLAQLPAEFVVTTFGADRDEGASARRFYLEMGFYPAEPAPDGPEGGSRQIFRRMKR
jgi:GNAT superfamily N-acetyltransferase